MLDKAIDFIISRSRPEDGYITHRDTRMYSHAFATLFLAYVYGMTKRDDVRHVLKRAVDLIVLSQNNKGGWRYQPMPLDDDLSVTVSTLQALRAARDVGIAVPSKVINAAINYVRKCATPYGAFNYQPVSYTRTSYALTACGVTSLYSLGKYDYPEVIRGIRALHNPSVVGERLWWGSFHYFYGHFYASQAMYVAGGEY